MNESEVNKKDFKAKFLSEFSKVEYHIGYVLKAPESPQISVKSKDSPEVYQRYLEKQSKRFLKSLQNKLDKSKSDESRLLKLLRIQNNLEKSEEFFYDETIKSKKYIAHKKIVTYTFDKPDESEYTREEIIKYLSPYIRILHNELKNTKSTINSLIGVSKNESSEVKAPKDKLEWNQDIKVFIRVFGKYIKDGTITYQGQQNQNATVRKLYSIFRTEKKNRKQEYNIDYLLKEFNKSFPQTDK